jgi:hypothetical protein
MIKLKILLALVTHRRLERAARAHRRTLRDHLRRETSRIRKLETRSRGLRLYSAWAASETSKMIRQPAEAWDQASLLRSVGEIRPKTPVAA